MILLTRFAISTGFLDLLIFKLHSSIHFLYAKGSAGELRTQIYIGMDIGYIDSKQGKEWINETEEISKMLYSLIKSIKAKIH